MDDTEVGQKSDDGNDASMNQQPKQQQQQQQQHTESQLVTACPPSYLKKPTGIIKIIEMVTV